MTHWVPEPAPGVESLSASPPGMWTLGVMATARLAAVSEAMCKMCGPAEGPLTLGRSSRRHSSGRCISKGYVGSPGRSVRQQLAAATGVSLAGTPERWGSSSEPWSTVLGAEGVEHMEFMQKAKQGCSGQATR